jgi:drug/metabolite transporter (DMT)-like permease
MIARPREERAALGVVLMTCAFLFFSLIDASAKWLVTGGFMILQVAWLRYVGHFLLTFCFYWRTEGHGLWRSNALVLQILRGIVLMSGTVLNFAALKYLPLTITIAIFFASPLLICLLSIPLLGERVGLRRFAAIGLGFLGVLVIVQPFGDSFNWAALLSLGALLSASMYFILTRMIAGRDDNAVSQFIPAGIGTFALLPFVIGEWRWPEGTIEIGLAIVIGLCGFVGHTFATLAARYAEASTLAPVIYSQIIFITALSWIVFSDPPDIWTIIGTGIIVASGLFVWQRERGLALEK